MSKVGTEIVVRALAFGATGDDATEVSSANPLPVSATSTPAALPAGTSRSGTITLGGTAQDLAAANTARKSLTVQNISVGDLWINENGGTAAAAGTDAFLLSPGATTGQAFSATET